MNVRQIIGDNFRRLRIAADLSQQEVAERLGIDRAHVSALEQGKRNPTIVSLWHISLALGAPIIELLRDMPSEASEPFPLRKRVKRPKSPTKKRSQHTEDAAEPQKPSTKRTKKQAR